MYKNSFLLENRNENAVFASIDVIRFENVIKKSLSQFSVINYGLSLEKSISLRAKTLTKGNAANATNPGFLPINVTNGQNSDKRFRI